MKKIILLFIVCFAINLNAQNYEWSRSFADDNYANVQSLSSDLAGNVIVGMGFRNTVDFDFGPGVTSLTSTGNWDGSFAKYNSSGNLLWTKSIGGGGLDIIQNAITDQNGNVYILGFFQSTADFDPSAAQYLLSASTLQDVFFAKYDSNGNFLWAKNLGGGVYNVPRSIVVDPTGNVFVMGYFQGTADFDPSVTGVFNMTNIHGNSFWDTFVAKYDGFGNFIWAQKIEGTSDVLPKDLVIDNSGNIYLAGSFVGIADFNPGVGTANLNEANGAYFFAKYDANGNYIWANNLDAFSGRSNIALDNSGNIYLTGSYVFTVDFDPSSGVSNLTSSNSYNVFFAKYNTNGNFIWAKSIDNFSTEVSKGIAVDQFNNVYLDGLFYGDADFDPSAGTHILSSNPGAEFVAKYNANGDFVFANDIQPLYDVDNKAFAINNRGEIFVGGNFRDPLTLNNTSEIINSNGQQHGFFVKYNQPTNAGNDQSICLGNSAQFYGYSANAISYLWDFGDGNTSTVLNPTHLYSIAGNYSVLFTAYDSIGGATSDTTLVNIATSSLTNNILGQTTNLCSYIFYPYDVASPNSFNTYTWTPPPGGIIYSGQGTSHLELFFDNTATGGSLSVTETNVCGTASIDSIYIAAPGGQISAVGNIVGPIEVCPTGNPIVTYSLDTIIPGANYVWTVYGAAAVVSGQGTASVDISLESYFNNGTVLVHISSPCGDSPDAFFNFNATVPPTIIGQTVGLCPLGISSAAYYIPPVSGATSYLWTNPYGTTIINGQGTDSVTISFDSLFTSGDLSVVPNTCNLPSNIYLSAAPTSSFYIAGQYYGLCNSTTLYKTSAPSNAVCTWTVPSGATILSGQGTDSILVSFDSSFTADIISVVASNSCGTSFQVATYLYSAPLYPQGGIMGPFTEVCHSTSTVYSVVPVAGATSYSWIVPAGINIVSGQGTDSIFVTIDSTFTVGALTVTANNACGSSFPLSQVIETTPNQVYFNGPYQEMCNYLNSTVTYSLNANSPVTVNWTVPSGMTIIDGQGTSYLTVFIDSTFTGGNLSSDISNSCGSRPFSIELETIPNSPTSISGQTDNICNDNISWYAYTVSDASGPENYTWTTPPGTTIVYGQGTPLIYLTFDSTFTGGDLSVFETNSCGVSGTTSVTLSPAPTLAGTGPISGITTGLCPAGISSTNYSIAAQPGAASYTWTTPTGVTITSGDGTEAITVSIDNTFTSGTLSVFATSICGINTPTTSIELYSKPTTLSAIIGDAGICKSSTGNIYSVPASTGATTYTWTVTSGMTITSGLGTNSITINTSGSFSGGTVSVSASNACGPTPVITKSLTVPVTPAKPSAISGSTTLCSNETGITYSTAGSPVATSYVWAVPTGATIVSGQGTTSIVINTSSSFTGGTISVYAVNYCKTSATRTLSLSLPAPPPAPASITGPTSVCDNQTGLSYTAALVSGATVYQWTVPAGATIVSGQTTNSIIVDWGATSGDVSVKATVACRTSAAKTKHVSTHSCSHEQTIDSSKTQLDFVVYPNPNNGSFSLTINDSQHQNITIKITNVLGETVYSGQTTSDSKMDLNLEGNAKGMYMIQLSTANKTYFQKIVIQ